VVWDRIKIAAKWIIRPQHIIALIAFTFVYVDLAIKSLSWITAVLVSLGLLPWLLSYVKQLGLVETVELPGGVKLALSQAATKAREAGLLEEPAPTPEIENELAKDFIRDPMIALATLRVELERRLRRLAELSALRDGSVRSDRKFLSLTGLTQALQEQHVLSPLEGSAIRDVVPTLNMAAHAQDPSREAGEWAIDFGPRILAALDSKIAGIETLQTHN
jgi:hypothetical protein